MPVSIRSLLLSLVPFLLARDCLSASWTLDYVKNADGSQFMDIDGPTVIKIGPDLRYYVGARGYVYALTINDAYEVLHVCQSQSIGEDRTVLGMAFEPRKFDQNDVYFYIGTATLNWGGGASGNPSDVPGGWKNGMVQIIRGNQHGECLAVTRNLVTGLSVSNHDHGVNGMVVGLDGRLYVIDGGMTNAGHSELGDGDGGSPATPLSGALLVVDYNKVGFNGDVIYDSNDGRVANIVGDPDVKVHTSGLMNAFGIELHTNGEMYMVDNGPNPGYGKESTSCTTNLETEPHYPDKFLLVKEGAWYGHPNRNRGRTDTKQCVFRSIYADVEDQEQELQVIESSTNGIAEYSANLLGEDFKGAMCFARIGFGEPGNSFALFLSEKGDEVTKREEIMGEGGLDMVLDIRSNLVVTDFMNRRIKVLKPVPEGPVTSAPVAVYTVHPKYGPQSGGNKIWIIGKFPSGGISVLFGSRICQRVTRITGSAITCYAPRGKGNTAVRVTVEVDGVRSPAVGKEDYIYMNSRANGPLLNHMF